MREVAMRHRTMLANIMNKRKQEEEELQQLMQQEQEKKKKFRENLLEKAMRARQQEKMRGAESDEDEEEEEDGIMLTKRVPITHKSSQPKQQQPNVPEVPKKKIKKDLPVSSSLLQPTTAYKNQSVVKTAQEVILTDEQLAQQEEAKREYIAMIRKKFKDQHKKILAQLAAKKKEQEDKVGNSGRKNIYVH